MIKKKNNNNNDAHRIDVPGKKLIDGRTVVRSVNDVKAAGKSRKVDSSHTVLIAGFPGPGLVGSIATSYIIEQLHMHQIAYVDSEFIMPGVIYIGGKLRHPFRLYSNNEGNVSVLVCDAPMSMSGIHSVLNTVVNWAIQYGIQEVIVVEGMPVEGLPDPNRQPLVLSNNDNKVDDDGYLRYFGKSLDEKNDRAGKKISTAFIAGTSGGLLASCLSNGILCKGILVPAPSGIPDPEGAAIIVDKINSMDSIPIKINADQLREQGAILKSRMDELVKSIRGQRSQQQRQQEQMPISDQSIYG